MKTRLTPREEIKRLFVETLLSKTDKVTKVADNSVLSGVGYGVASVASRAIKDIALAEIANLPDLATGTELDDLAEKLGVSVRSGATGSSTYVRLFADPGTFYDSATTSFTTKDGIEFELESDVNITSLGFTYAKVASVQTGERANVASGEIYELNPIPSGHQYVINEAAATGGRDAEGDEQFRQRIKQSGDSLARGTIAYIEQVFNKINPNVLRVFFQGVNSIGQVILAICTQNGADLNQSQLDDLLEQGEPFFSLTDLRPFGAQNYTVVLKNIEYHPVDVSFRIDFLSGVDQDVIRKEIQVGIQGLIDYRTWRPGVDKFEWDDALLVVKQTRGVRYVPNQFFVPNQDITIPTGKLPRLRGFLMLDLDGAIIADLQGNFSPFFYPFDSDFLFTKNILNNI